MPDTISVAILTRLNDLAARHGLRPYDFVARVTARSEGGRSRWEVVFDAPPADPAKAGRFHRMLAAVGVARPESAVLTGGVDALLDALDAALLGAASPARPGRSARFCTEPSPGSGAPDGGEPVGELEAAAD